MISRRGFGGLALAGLNSRMAFAQHAAVQGAVPADTVWLNANENPEGPPPEAREAIAHAIADAGRYNHRVFPSLYAALAKAAGVETEQVIVGAGSTEVLHCAIDAFTSAGALITCWPTWEMTRDLVDFLHGRLVHVGIRFDRLDQLGDARRTPVDFVQQRIQRQARFQPTQGRWECPGRNLRGQCRQFLRVQAGAYKCG